MAAAASPRHPPNVSLRAVEDGGPRFGKAVLLVRSPHQKPGKALHAHVHLPDRAAAADAAELIARFGEYAASEAAARANRSRDVGNVDHFCRWRQIERLVLLLAAGPGNQRIH